MSSAYLQQVASAVHPLHPTLQFTSWSDGVQCWGRDGSGGVHIERIRGRCATNEIARLKWHIVDRTGFPTGGMYPPIVSGPFENVKTAIVALELLGGIR